MTFQLLFLIPGPWLLPFLSCIVWCRLHYPSSREGWSSVTCLAKSPLPKVSIAPLTLVYRLGGWVKEEFRFPPPEAMRPDTHDAF